MDKPTPDNRASFQPIDTDPDEINIRSKLESLLTTNWSKSTIQRLKEIQQNFFEFSLNNFKDKSAILAKYRGTLANLSEATKSTLGTLPKDLDKLRESRGLIVVTNHLGLPKLTRIDNSQKVYGSTLSSIEPFPVRHAALLLLADKLNHQEIHEASIELPSPILEIQEACEVLTISPSGSGRTSTLQEKVRALLARSPHSLIVMYPEGGTSGKRNHGGPYDLEDFKTGSFVIGAELEIPIIPVTQFFDPNEGIKVDVADPIFLKPEDLDKVGEIAGATQLRMQKILDQRIHGQK